MFVHGCQGGETETASYLLETRRIPPLLDELVQEIEDLALTLGKWLHAENICKQKAKIKAGQNRSGTIEGCDFPWDFLQTDAPSTRWLSG
jgi:hypothetical protein